MPEEQGRCYPTSPVGLPAGHATNWARGQQKKLNLIHEGQPLGKGEEGEEWRVHISGWVKRK